MKGVQYQDRCNVHNKRVHNYDNSIKKLVTADCDVCGSKPNQTKIRKFIESIGDNSIVFHNQENREGDFASAIITYDVGPKNCGNC